VGQGLGVRPGENSQTYVFEPMSLGATPFLDPEPVVPGEDYIRMLAEQEARSSLTKVTVLCSTWLCHFA